MTTSSNNKKEKNHWTNEDYKTKPTCTGSKNYASRNPINIFINMAITIAHSEILSYHPLDITTLQPLESEIAELNLETYLLYFTRSWNSIK